MKNYNAEIGTWLARKREEKGLSQSDVAKRMNVTKSAVHYWETNKREIRADRMIEYCLVLDVSPQELVKDVMNNACL